MIERNAGTDKRLRLFTRVRRLAVLVAGLALVLLALAPFGWRAGLWHYRISFELIALAGLLAIVAALGAGLGLTFGRVAGWRSMVLPLLAVFLGLGVLVAMWEIRQHGAAPIHDITTDVENPPAFLAALPARRAEHAAPDAYAGSDLARQQKAAYPDIAPAMLALKPAQAFALALATAKAMPGWTIVATDPPAGRIEASQASFWFGFVDDIVIRVAAAGEGSRVDMRSLSRQGRGDLGVNARRIRAYMAALGKAAG